MATVYLRRKPMWKRVLSAPRLFARFFRIVRGLPLAERARFAAWQTWQSVKGF